MADYPVQLNKVQAPPLRDETLARDRLLDWLHVKINRRAVLVLAEAGYGKTTLLADFTRRSRLPIAWYRLDRGDRDWTGFVAHLVAAFRIHQPDFAPVTQSMLRETASAMPSRDAVVDTFLRELGELPAEPAALVLDDFHLVDDAPDPRHIVRELLTRAPERLSVVLVSRRMPALPLARLRSLGEVAELRTADLRFMPEETDRLFRETFAFDLEPSVVAELSRRTEGWVASLQLVRAAIRDRDASEIRSFVRSLSGAEGHLYDYLAEEVVGELAGDLQQFLMRTSLLEVIDPVLGGVAAGISPELARERIGEGEVLGLFSRIGPTSRDEVRAHPLVRDFLRARLGRLVGTEDVTRIHRSVAEAAESVDWRIAGHHFIAAGDHQDARRVLAGAIEAILAAGAYSAAEELVTKLPDTPAPDPNVLVILSRLAQQRGELDRARELAESAYALRPDSVATALNLQAALFHGGDIEAALHLARRIESESDRPTARLFAKAVRATVLTSMDGSLEEARAALSAVIDASRRRGDRHYLGVGLLDIGHIVLASGDALAAIRYAKDAIANLEETSAGIELVSARLLYAWTLAHTGNLTEARTEINRALEAAPRAQWVEVAFEGAEIEVRYGDPREAQRLLAIVDDHGGPGSDAGEQAALVQALIDLALGRIGDARSAVTALRERAPRSSIAFEARRQLADAVTAIVAGDPLAHPKAAAARDIAERQGARLWSRVAHLCIASLDGTLTQAVREEGDRDSTSLTLAAEVLSRNLDNLDRPALDMVLREARQRPARWRSTLRSAVSETARGPRLQAALLLDEIGAAEDVAVLRHFARIASDRSVQLKLGRGLARRLAPKVMVEDLVRVRILVGSRSVEGSAIRRKVLALLCFLLTKQRFSATREEVLEALWPDLEPDAALNSLNQTVYFLRRVFEPRFTEDLTPGYVGQDGETVWLDVELVQSQSRTCRDLIRTLARDPDPELTLRLARMYSGRFALEFTYEEWAASYRDSLHASYLQVVEATLRADTEAGRYARGIELAQSAIETEPGSDEIEAALVRLYRLSNSMAAAAEQYERYVRAMHELGVDAVPLDAI